MIRLTLILLSLLSKIALAEEAISLKDTLREIAKDLSSLQEDINSYTTEMPLMASLEITSKVGKIRTSANESADIIVTVPRGENLPILAQVDDWYAVDLSGVTDKGGTGWVSATEVTPVSIPVSTSVSTSDPVLLLRIEEKGLDSDFTPAIAQGQRVDIVGIEELMLGVDIEELMLGQGQRVDVEVLRELLGQVQGVQYKEPNVYVKQTWKDKLYDTLLEKVLAIKEKYSSNPYVNVSGFSIEASIPPSVSVDFVFKD